MLILLMLYMCVENVCQCLSTTHTLLFSLARQQFGPQCIQDRQKPSGSTSLPDQVVKLVAQVPLQVWVRTDWERLRLDDQYKKTAKDGQRCQSQFPSPGQWPTSSPRPKAAQDLPYLNYPPLPPPQNNFQNYFQGVDSVFGCYTKQPSLG